jgi:hypothetical protein
LTLGNGSGQKIVIEKMQFATNLTGGNSNTMFTCTGTNAATLELRKCRFRDINSNSTSNHCIRVILGGSKTYAYDCVFYNFGGIVGYTNIGGIAPIEFYNCTFIDNNIIVQPNYGTSEIKMVNCLTYSNTTFLAGSGDLGTNSNYNATDDSSAPTGFGANSLTSVETMFSNYNSADFRLNSSDTKLHSAGIGTIDANIQDTDIIGTPRGLQNTSIGAFEYIPAVIPATPPITFRKPPPVFFVDGVGDGTNTTVGSITVTHGLNCREGDILIAAVHWNSTLNAITSNGGVFISEFDEENPTTSNSRQAIFYRYATSNEAATWQFDCSDGGSVGVAIAQFRGIEKGLEITGANIWEVAPSAAQRNWNNSSSDVDSYALIAPETLGVQVLFCDDEPVNKYPVGLHKGYGNEIRSTSGRLVSIFSKYHDKPTAETAGCKLNASNDWSIHHFALKLKKPIIKYGFAFDNSAKNKRVVVF